MAVLYRDGTTLPADADYVVSFTGVPARTLLDAHAPAWDAARAIEWGPVAYRTAFRALRAEAALALRFDCTDDAPWHTMTCRDQRLWEEEVVEIFVNPAGASPPYAEVEISPANVVCDLRIVQVSPWLQGEIEWDFEGLETAVTSWVAAPPAGWTATALLPWTGFDSLSRQAAARVPPAAGDRWRFNVFRIKRPGGPADPERDAIYAAWSMPDGVTFHAPEAFKELVFAA
jgi:hypothetical protein